MGRHIGVKVQPITYQGLDLANIVNRVIGTGGLGSIATVTPDGRPYIHTAYYSTTGSGTLVFISGSGSTHSRNLEYNPRCAIAIHPLNQEWDDWKTGIQGFGTVSKLKDEERDRCLKVYGTEYPEYIQWIEQEPGGQSRFGLEVFEITLHQIQILAEEELGEENLVTVEVI